MFFDNDAIELLKWKITRILKDKSILSLHSSFNFIMSCLMFEFEFDGDGRLRNNDLRI